MKRGRKFKARKTGESYVDQQRVLNVGFFSTATKAAEASFRLPARKGSVRVKVHGAVSPVSPYAFKALTRTILSFQIPISVAIFAIFLSSSTLMLIDVWYNLSVAFVESARLARRWTK